MSWSVNAVGKVGAVAAKIKQDFSRITCAEPENEIKNLVASSIELALAKYPADKAVRVEASGSQYVPDSTKPEEALNSFSVKVEPVYGFVE